MDVIWELSARLQFLGCNPFDLEGLTISRRSGDFNPNWIASKSLTGATECIGLCFSERVSVQPGYSVSGPPAKSYLQRPKIGQWNSPRMFLFKFIINWSKFICLNSV